MRKAVTAIGLALVFLLAIPLASGLVVSHYRRWQASKLLAIVRQLHPGITTEAQTRAALKPFSRYEERFDQQSGGIVISQVYYPFYNSTGWTRFLAYHLRFLPFPITLPWTLFSVQLDLADGFLAEIRVTEMQEDQPGYPHPNSASVSVFSNRLNQQPGKSPGPIPTDFNGYSEHSQSTGGIDEKGNWITFNCCHARFIEIDERATQPSSHNH